MVGTEAAIVVSSAPVIELARDVPTQKLKEIMTSLLYASQHFTSRAINLGPQLPSMVMVPSRGTSDHEFVVRREE
jgi:hypothetical protein